VLLFAISYIDKSSTLGDDIMQIEYGSPKPETYQIIVSGHLDTRWKDWFDGFTISHQTNSETYLIGLVADQAALHGLLAKIRDLGLSLLSVTRLGTELGKNI
jgi:hypothetical protein